MKYCITLLFFTLIYSTSFSQIRYVKIKDLTLAYESFASVKNHTILLISGTNSQMTMWSTDFCKKLSKKGFRVIRFDNRDVGLSTKLDKLGLPDWAAIGKALQEQKTPPLPYSLDDMADDAIGLLDSLGIHKAHIVGISMGAMIAQRVAYNHPEYTLSLTSIAAGGGSPTFPLLANMEAVSKIPPLGSPTDTLAYIKREIISRNTLAGNVYLYNQALLEKEIRRDVNRAFYLDGFHRQGAAALTAFYAGRQNQLKSIKVPSLIIHGSLDPMVVIDAGKDVANNIPGANFILIEGMGHALPTQLNNKIISLIVTNARQSKNK
jgi:pimeloyl-ACP methyl ester carboxylesterase